MLHEQCAALIQALDLLDATQVALGKGLARSDERRRHDLVTLRRALSDHTAKVGKLGDALFEQLGDRDLLAEYHRLFSAARSKAALHQADWSAVRVGEREEDYRRSARAAGEAHGTLTRWIRATVADIVKR